MAKDLLTTAGRIRHALDKLSRLYPEHFAHRTPTMDDEAEPRGGWLTADCTIPSGESLVRHLLYESHGNEETAPQDDTLCWLPAHPGLSGALPQILRGAGFRTVIMPPRHRSPMPTCCWKASTARTSCCISCPPTAHQAMTIPPCAPGSASCIRRVITAPAPCR